MPEPTGKPDASAPSNPESAVRPVRVPLAKLRQIIFGGLVGLLIGAVLGNGFIGAFGGSIVTAFAESIAYFRPKRFAELRRQRQSSALVKRAEVGRGTAVLYALMLNSFLAITVAGVIVIAVGFINVKPADFGLADDEVSQQRFYLTLGATALLLAGCYAALIWGLILDFAEHIWPRFLLGLLALAAESWIAFKWHREYIEGPDTPYANTLGFFLMWASLFICDPLRWVRASRYGNNSRLAALASDVVAAIPGQVFVAREPASSPPEDDAEKTDPDDPDPPPPT